MRSTIGAIRSPLAAWSAITASRPAEARVCSHDRFGTSTSDAPPTDQTFTSEAADLHQLIQIAGEIRPYVVVGHSFGDAEAVAFTSRTVPDTGHNIQIDQPGVVVDQISALLS
jgi:pimeloyl-ACP methyl ester carboxylesterase